MAVGMQFPYDFGFIPGTLGEDGDPLDVIVLLDLEVPVGCMVRCRLLGVIEAEQIESKGTKVRNDRFVAVPTEIPGNAFGHLKSIEELNPEMLKELERFFENYNKFYRVKFNLLNYGKIKRAKKLILQGTKKRSSKK